MPASSQALIRLASALGLGCLLASTLPSSAAAQQQAQGFAVERLMLSAPGSWWLAVDDLSQQGGLGGAASFTLGYAHAPLSIRSSEGTQRLDVVDDQAFASVALAVTYDRLRIHARFASPLYVAGHGGTVDGWQYTAPGVNLSQHPDSINDVRLGVDVRVLGGPTDPVRLGVSGEVIFPSGLRSDYVTDGSYRGVARLLAAGGSGRLRWAGHIGAHVRPLDEPSPGSPRGSELLVGIAGGALLPAGRVAFLIGPELHAATPFRAFLGSGTTAVEALLTATYRAPIRLRVKAGVGGGIDPQFGAPAWRAVLQFETETPLE